MAAAKSVYGLMAQNSLRLPTKTALVVRDGRISFSDLKERVYGLAFGLKDLGIRRGDRFAICLPNSLELVTAFYALAGLGAITTWINPAYVGERFDFILSDSGARGIIMDPQGENFFRLNRRQCGEKRFPSLDFVIPTAPCEGFVSFLELGPGKESLLQPLPHADENDICTLIYTSGATGVPKGAPATHAQVVRQARVYTDALSARERDVFLGALPMFHSYGFISLLVQAVALGATLVVMDAWDAGEALRLIEKEKVSVHLAAPTHYIMEMKHPDFEKRDLGSLRSGLISGYVPPAELMLEIENRFNFHFCNFWGSSETGPGLISPWSAPREKRLFTVGKPVPGEEVRIVAPGAVREVPLGEMGELAVRGWNVIHGYWKNPVETERHFDGEGWYHTGDLAFVDPEGYVTIAGRTKDQINRGGLKIVPFDLEKNLLNHPGVHAVSVVGTHNPVLGESICACVIPERGWTPNLKELRDFVEPLVGKKSLPDEMVAMECFPMLSGGVKINKYGTGGLQEAAQENPRRQQWWKMKENT
jgi:fatty-acyl-CoA synthase/long-chain acyl-CoA synthetase